MRNRLGFAVVATTLVLGSVTATASAAPGSPPPAFSNTPLISTWQPPAGLTTAPHANSTGNSEPAIAFGSDGTMAVDGLAWLPFQVNLWKGRFGTTPGYFGAMDTDLDNVGNGRITLGDGDADVEITAAGTLLLADLDFVVNRPGNALQLGVSVTRCPAGSTSPAQCNHIFLDTAGADREWITSAGSNVWISYHDSQNSTLIRVKRSTDDGRTWTAAGSPIPGQGRATGDATFNNSIGPIVADPSTGVLYESYAAGEPQTKSTSADFNNIYVSRSTDGGEHWTSTRVFHTTPFTRLNNFWPSLAFDPITHALHTAWTDIHGVRVSSSTDQGVTWSAPVLVSTATTTVMPWAAARNGKVDVVYYGSTAASTDDPTAVWNTYDSQLSNGTWTVKKVSNTPNRVGVICLEGSACTGNRELLDLFEVAEDPVTGKAAVIYTDTTIDTWTDSSGTHQLPEIILAFER
ncbi:MAG TPA: sialidase family protein [Micromonosporaceae bacterium]|nr:sialidase family protein [Micromonosporaceae bacterium]